MTQKKRVSRRKIFGLASGAAGASLIADPRILFLQNMMRGFIQTAMAEDGGYDPRRYIYIQQPGAPPRWMFDLFLTPYSDKGFVPNPMVGTRFTASGGRHTGIKYETVKRKSINVPYMWQFDVPRAGGGMRPMTELLEHLVGLQGIHTGNAGHPGSQLLHFKPTGSVRSLPALTGDFADTPISAVNFNASNYRYASLKGRTAAQVKGDGNLLEILLQPFSSQAPPAFLKKLTQIETDIEAALVALDKYGESLHPGARSLAADRTGAEKLLRQGFPGLAKEWERLVMKYQDLIERAIDSKYRMDGINDLPIGVSAEARGSEYNLGGEGNRLTTPDLRQLIVENTTIIGMAAHFAAAEYVVRHDLSRSVALSLGPMTNLSRVGNSVTTSGFDEHDTGRMASLYINIMYNRALSACLLELIDGLKDSGIFRDTVIDVGGEFNRAPRSDSSGSDHGFQGASVALYSGAFTGPLLIGNMASNVSSGYPGTWGYGAGVSGLGGSQIAMNHLASTIAAAIRAPSPVTSASTLISFNKDATIPLVEKTKIVV